VSVASTAMGIPRLIRCERIDDRAGDRTRTGDIQLGSRSETLSDLATEACVSRASYAQLPFLQILLFTRVVLCWHVVFRIESGTGGSRFRDMHSRRNGSIINLLTSAHK